MAGESSRHRCFGKIRKIFERVGILLTHAEITYLCELVLHCAGEKEFYDAIGRMSDAELTEMIHEMRKKRRRVGADEVSSTEVVSAYA